jgi:hypothetical protein
MATRDALLAAVAVRYRGCGRSEKSRILDEFASVTGHHRKHAMRLLRSDSVKQAPASRPGRRVYDAAVRAALIVLWEAPDRICGKRLKAMIPTLLPAMERHGHLDLVPEIRAALLGMSAATIDRALRPQRARSGSGTRRRKAPSALRSSIPVRTFSDWNDPPPGFIEVDLVAHSGPVASGAFIQTLVLTDIATGWTECAPFCSGSRRSLSACCARCVPGCRFRCSGSTRTTTACSSTRRSGTTASPSGSSSPAAGPTGRTTKPTSNRRTARSCAASSVIGGSTAWRPPVSRLLSTRERGCVLIAGIGTMTATALRAAVDDGSTFTRARDLAA